MKTYWTMAGIVLAAMLCTAPSARSASAALPKDSVYQLPLQLTDQQGRRFDWRARRGHPQVVAMFYTSCAFTCPLIVDSGKAVEHALTRDQQREIGILLVSMDPRRDTPTKLMNVVKERGLDTARWTLASPEPDAVRNVASVLGVRYRQLPNGDFNHTSALVLLDRDGRIVARTERVGSALDPEFLDAVRAQVQGAGCIRRTIGTSCANMPQAASNQTINAPLGRSKTADKASPRT